jgi:hypothetical protein
MKVAAPSGTAHLSLAEVITHLSQQPQIEGILEIGSAATGDLTDASDYDLVIVLHDAPGAPLMPPWFVGITQIDHRLTDLIFVAASEVEQLLALTAAIAPGDPRTPVVRWVQLGVIIYDRATLLRRAQQHLASYAWMQPIDDQATHATWFSINYNLVQTRRLARATNPLYRMSAEIRMAVYGHTDLWHGYFTLHSLPWEGDKPAVAYLAEHDAEFLEAYRQFITETSVDGKLLAYERAAALAAAPMGGLWPPDTTAMNVDHALEIWQSLLHTEG